MSKKDIETIEDIKLMVDEFYGEVRQDWMLKDIFENVIQDRWPEHLDKMYRFWQTVLLEEHTYHGSPFWKHADLPVKNNHFKRWLLLFNATVDAHFSGEKAEKAKWQGQRMAEMFYSKIEFYKTGISKSLS